MAVLKKFNSPTKPWRMKILIQEAQLLRFIIQITPPFIAMNPRIVYAVAQYPAATALVRIMACLNRYSQRTAFCCTKHKVLKAPASHSIFTTRWRPDNMKHLPSQGASIGSSQTSFAGATPSRRQLCSNTALQFNIHSKLNAFFRISVMALTTTKGQLPHNHVHPHFFHPLKTHVPCLLL